MDTEYPERPISAVSAVVFNSDQDILLIQRNKAPYKNQWSIPGGRVHLGEQLEIAAKREVKEECGIDIRIGRLNQISTQLVYDTNDRLQYHYIIINYVAFHTDGTVSAGSDAKDARWVSASALSGFPLANGIPETIAKAIQTLHEIRRI